MEDWQDVDRRVRADIARRGFHLGLVPGVDDTPGWAFSVGLSERYQHAELLCFGIDDEFLLGLADALAGRVASGQRFEAGREYAGVLSDHAVAIRTVDRKWYATFLGNVAYHYGSESFEAVQCFWPDRAGRFPWDDDFDAAWRQDQPLLFHRDTERALPDPLIEVLRREHAL